jgi:hypothetical protein
MIGAGSSACVRLLGDSEKTTKMVISLHPYDDDMQTEYDFRNSVRMTPDQRLGFMFAMARQLQQALAERA